MSRFATLNPVQLEELISDKDAKRTKKATEQSWRIFLAYCKEKKIAVDIINVTKLELNDVLKTFYAEARKCDGTLYRKTSLSCLRHGINRKIKEHHSDWDIIDDPEFGSSCIVFRAQCVRLKREGLAKVEHYPPISENDLKKLYSCNVFNIDNPKNLQWKVFFELVFFLCRRGQENLRELKKTSFIIRVGENGGRYIEKAVDELTKNHRVNDEEEDGGIIYERSDDMCPVKSFEKYISKLNPKIDCLFQRPKKEAPKNGPWYDAQAVGVNSIEKFMTNISVVACLSRKYTNHSIRASTITVLDGAGYEERHILTVSGHRNPDSLRSYCRTNIGTKRKMSETLSRSIQNIDRNFNLGVDFLKEPQTTVNDENRPGPSRNLSIENVPSDCSKDYPVTSVQDSHHMPLVITNNTDCVVNIRF